MKALVLAAGRGERLRPLTDSIPKPILEAGGRRLIEYPLLMLKRAGVTEVAINLHHLGDQLSATLGDGASLGMRIRYAPEPRLLGTAGPLPGLADFFAGQSFVVLNSDTIIDLDLRRAIECHRDRNALATFVLRRPAQNGVYSEILMDPHGRIGRMRLLTDRANRGFEEFQAPTVEPSSALASYMFCGITICEPSVLKLPLAPPPSSLMGDLFAPALRAGAKLYGFEYEGYFRTIDDLAAYEALQQEFRSNPPQLAFVD
ncbi:MAG: NDP-sugar synthase [Candidatus Binataceae bacterium]|nr:NDP-sugar synthase [Candidatus Binataceae bacterium]